MALGQKAVRGRLAEYVNEIAAKTDDEAMKKACAEYIDTFNDSGANRVAADALIAELEKASAYDCEVASLQRRPWPTRTSWRRNPCGSRRRRLGL